MSKAKKREEISGKYKWDLSKIYKSLDELNNDVEEVKVKIKELLKYKGRLLESSKTLLEATDKYFETMRIVDKLVVYSNMKYHEDLSLSKS